MRHFLSMISILLLILSCTLSPSTAGSGHEGEARIIGIAFTSTGEPMKNGELFVATSDYLPELTRSTYVSGMSITTDENGAFEIYLLRNSDYVLSSKRGGELAYRAFTTNNNQIDLGAIYHVTGSDVTVDISDNPDMTYHTLRVPGTDWIYSLDANSSTTVKLPSGDFDIVLNGTKNSTGGGTEQLTDTLKVDIQESGTTITEQTIIGIPSDTLRYTFSDSAAVNMSCTLDIIAGNLVFDSIKIDWGDGNSEFADSTGLQFHYYSDTGWYYMNTSFYTNQSATMLEDSIFIYY